MLVAGVDLGNTGDASSGSSGSRTLTGIVISGFCSTGAGFVVGAVTGCLYGIHAGKNMLQSASPPKQYNKSSVYLTLCLISIF